MDTTSVVDVAIAMSQLEHPPPKLEPLLVETKPEPKPPSECETKEETKLIYEPETRNQKRTCSACYIWSNLVQFLFWWGVIGVCSWTVNDARVVVERCKSLNFYYQNGCLDNHNADVVKYAVGIAVIIMSLFMLIRQFGEICRVVTKTNWSRTYTCINGVPNKDLCFRLAAWIFFVVLICSLVCLIYFSTRDLQCEGHNSDYQAKRDEYVACVDWKNRVETSSHIAGLAFGIIGTVVSVLGLWCAIGFGGFAS